MDMCLSISQVPLSFSPNEKLTIKNMMKAFKLKKIVLYLKAHRGAFYFASNGMMTHFKTLLSAIDTDAEKENLRYVTYSLDKSLTETMTVLNPPYTLVKEAGGTYSPLICQWEDAVSSDLMGLQFEIADWTNSKTDHISEVTEDLHNLVNETKQYVGTAEGGKKCPAVELTAMDFAPLFPFYGTTSWDGVSTFPDFRQEEFMTRWRDLQRTLERAPKNIQHARDLLELSDIVPSRNSPLYIFSAEFHENLKSGQSFEILLTFSICVVSLLFCGCCVCIKYYCCRNITFYAMAVWIWRKIRLLRVPVVPPLSEDSAGQQEHEEVGGGPSFPLQVWSRNYHVMQPRRGMPSNRQGHFEIIYNPTRNPPNQRSAQGQFEEI